MELRKSRQFNSDLSSISQMPSLHPALNILLKNGILMLLPLHHLNLTLDGTKEMLKTFY